MSRQNLKCYRVEYTFIPDPRSTDWTVVLATSKKRAIAMGRPLMPNQRGLWRISRVSRIGQGVDLAEHTGAIRESVGANGRSPVQADVGPQAQLTHPSPDKGRSGGVGVVLPEEAERAIQDADFSGWMDLYGWRDVKDEVPLPLEDVLVAHGDPRTGLLIDIGWIDHKGVWCRKWCDTVAGLAPSWAGLDAKYWQGLPLLPPIPTQDGGHP